MEHIPFGQFGIDDMCAAPMNTFHDVVWQSGPHFDVDDLPNGWMEWPCLTLNLCPSEMKRLRNLFDVDFFDAIELQKRFVVCKHGTEAHSRRYQISSMHWDSDEAIWRVGLVQWTRSDGRLTLGLDVR